LTRSLRSLLIRGGVTVAIVGLGSSVAYAASSVPESDPTEAVGALSVPAEDAVDREEALASLSAVAEKKRQEKAAADAAAAQAAAAAAQAQAEAAAKAAADAAAAQAAADAQEAARKAAAEAASRELARTATTPDGARAIARAMLADYGWSDSQFTCLNNLWTRESNWNYQARNTSSGAYGIPQSLPASKMASAGDDWRTNPATQIKWGLGYIQDVYGSPCGAWSHSQSVGWY